MANSKTQNNTRVGSIVMNTFVFNVHAAAVKAAHDEHVAKADAAFEAKAEENRAVAATRRAAMDVEWDALMADQRARIDNMDREFAERVAAMQRDHEARVAAMRAR